MPGGVGERWIGKVQRIFRAVKNVILYYNDGDMSVYICPNLLNVQYQEWILRTLGDYDVSVQDHPS